MVPVETSFFTCSCLCVHPLHPLRELLGLSIWSNSVLRFDAATVAPGDLGLAGRDVASLPGRQRGLPPFDGGVALGRVVNHHHGGIHSGQRVHAALARRVQPCGAELQLIIAGHLDERAPTKCPFEAGSKSGATWLEGKNQQSEQVVIWKEQRGSVVSKILYIRVATNYCFCSQFMCLLLGYFLVVWFIK